MARKIGYNHSEETKKKISIALIGNKNPSGCKRSEEHIKNMVANIKKANTGRKQSEEQKQTTSKFMKGNKYALGTKHTKEWKKKMSIFLIGNKYSIGRKHSEEHKENMRIVTMKRISIQKNNGMPVFPTIGKNEMYILDALEILYKINIIRQYQVAGFFVDGYDEKNNIVYEVDEKHHLKYKNNERDISRQKIIEEKLKCKFVRITD